MNIYIDIDNTITYTPPDANYTNAVPDHFFIAKVNQLYENGHHITMWTARGTVTGIDWESLTIKQLQEWGVKYHVLKMGKPAFDLFIDDKTLNVKNWNDTQMKKHFKEIQEYTTNSTN